MDRYSTPTVSCSRRVPALVAGLGLASTLLLGACDDAEPFDDSIPEEIEDLEPPKLTADDIAALQAEHRVASLPVGEHGRIDIVPVGTPDEPAFGFVTVGGPALADVMRQLVEDQGATPAEVFVSLVQDDASLPQVLLDDHLAQVASNPSRSAIPRVLDTVSFRIIDAENHGCLVGGSDVQPFNSWLSDWRGRFRFISTMVGFEWPAVGAGDSIHYVAADIDGRTLSACNATFSGNDVIVSYWALTFQPGPYYPYSYVWSTPLDNFDASHFYSTGNGPLYRMVVDTSGPGVNTYAVVGRCGNNC